MKSNVVLIDSNGNGFKEAVEQARKVSVFNDLNQDEELDLLLMTEEMLSLLNNVYGDIKASFWIEVEGGTRFELHMAAELILDKEKRAKLLSLATSRKNEAATGFLGRLRDKFEEAMTLDSDKRAEERSSDVLADIPYGIMGEPEWDGYERSILQSISDEVKIGIRGQKAEITVCKNYAK